LVRVVEDHERYHKNQRTEKGKTKCQRKTRKGFSWRTENSSGVKDPTKNSEGSGQK